MHSRGGQFGGGKRRAFTLLELLVVIAIIGILASLLLVVLGRAKGRAHSVGCLNNLKQWGVATAMFAVDNHDFLPNDGSPSPGNSATNIGWYIELPRVLGLPRYHDMPWRTNAAMDVGRSVWICPANPRRSNGNNLFHYCLNQHVNGTGAGNQPVTLSSVPRTASVVWLFDNGRLAAVAQQNNVHTNLHHEGAHFLFLDGHVARFPNPAYWNFKSNQGRTDNPSIVWKP